MFIYNEKYNWTNIIVNLRTHTVNIMQKSTNKSRNVNLHSDVISIIFESGPLSNIFYY